MFKIILPTVFLALVVLAGTAAAQNAPNNDTWDRDLILDDLFFSGPDNVLTEKEKQAAEGRQKAAADQAKQKEIERKIADKERQAAEGRQKTAAEQAARQEKEQQRAKRDAERAAKKAQEAAKP